MLTQPPPDKSWPKGQHFDTFWENIGERRRSERRKIEMQRCALLARRELVGERARNIFL
jgi:hypothetical protein